MINLNSRVKSLTRQFDRGDDVPLIVRLKYNESRQVVGCSHQEPGCRPGPSCHDSDKCPLKNKSVIKIGVRWRRPLIIDDIPNTY